MKTIIKYIFLFAIIFSLASCQNSEKNESFSPEIVSPVLGQWLVMAYIGDNAISKPFNLGITKSTTSGSDSIVIEDTTDDFWNFKVKAALSENKKAFETYHSNCEVSEYNIGVKISNGKIISEDSIYLEIRFEDDETPYQNVYQLKGKKVN